MPICTCKHNWQIWHHNAGTSRSGNITDQLWWRHNVKSEKTVLGANGEMRDQWLFFRRVVCSGYTIACKKMMYISAWIMIFLSPKIRYGKDFRSWHETHNHITSHDKIKITHTLFYIPRPLCQLYKFLIYIDGLVQDFSISIANTLEILGAVSIRKTVLPGMAIPMLKIRRPNGRLIFNMENAIRR